jgi:sugar phosphate permease
MVHVFVGGLADWMATYLLRYDHVSLDAAGLVVGAATIVGGIGGTLLGSKICAYYQTKWRNSFFLIPALFTIPGAICLLFAINISTDSDGAFVGIVFLLILSEICIWTYLAPISALSVSCISPSLRAR